MRRAAIASVSALLVLGLLTVDAVAGDGCCRHARRGHAGYGYVYRAPANPFAAWRAYYGAQAEIASARRAATANWYVATGRAPPRRYYGPPTN
ncbi:MAG TPA: hypothetical protein VFZ16_05850 [Hyphomicrobiaceae bacterium]|nr:hypothetical protein [Hyphomicrobiaceae bacterium]